MSAPSAGKRRHVLVTAGPTRERIDPVRFISNYSTARFGYEIAGEAKARGHFVTLVSGPTALDAPRGVKLVRVESALDMRRAVLREFPKAEYVIMASAVSDWRPVSAPGRKIKRCGERMTLKLVENPDILAGLGRRKGKKVLVGFALETEDLEANAFRKLKSKRLDLIVATRLGAGSPAFGDNRITIVIIDAAGGRTELSKKGKPEAAKIVLDKAGLGTL